MRILFNPKGQLSNEYPEASPRAYHLGMFSGLDNILRASTVGGCASEQKIFGRQHA